MQAVVVQAHTHPMRQGIAWRRRLVHVNRYAQCSLKRRVAARKRIDPHLPHNVPDVRSVIHNDRAVQAAGVRARPAYAFITHNHVVTPLIVFPAAHATRWHAFHLPRSQFTHCTHKGHIQPRVDPGNDDGTVCLQLLHQLLVVRLAHGVLAEQEEQQRHQATRKERACQSRAPLLGPNKRYVYHGGTFALATISLYGSKKE